jgi:hypothetical protein
MESSSRQVGVFLAAALACAPQLVSCGSSSEGGFHGDGGVAKDGARSDRAPESGGGQADGGIRLTTDAAGDSGGSTEAGQGAAVVYAESPDTLYRLDPTTNAITKVGGFSGDCSSRGDCTDVIDIALDAESNGYATTFNAFYRFDVSTAVTTFIASGSYPNSLSFVPKGTLDPNEEALVGYDGSTYIRIDTTSGAITKVGTLRGGYSSSGDIVSVINGGTFLTVTGNGCGDCLLQVDPKTGDLIQNYGSVNHPEVYGIAFWAGTVFGFDYAGKVFSITFPQGKLATTDIPVPGAPAGLQFYGAGSTTSAPPTATDGGGIPIK